MNTINDPQTAHAFARPARKPKPRAKKAECFACNTRLPATHSRHEFRSGLKLDFCLRCAGRVIGLVERELDAVAEKIRERQREVEAAGQTDVSAGEFWNGLDEALDLMGRERTEAIAGRVTRSDDG
jgi:hypothetical protein